MSVWSSASAVAHCVNGRLLVKDHAAALVALGDDVEEQVRLVATERQVAELIDDQQLRARGPRG